jgi:HD-GYP domain-containing protein (c-di-GMP phosphodiesterase class II)
LVSTADLPEGVKLRLPISDESNILLVAPGVALTPLMRDRLEQRGITAIQVHPSDFAKIRPKESTSELPNHGAGGADVAALNAGANGSPSDRPQAARKRASFLQKIAPRGTQPFDPREQHCFVQDREQSVQQVEQMFASIEVIRNDEIEAFQGLSVDALTKIAADVDLFVTLGITPAADRYPARHSHQTAMLAMAIGAQLGLDQKSLIDMGVGCLVHDIGMLHINRGAYDTPGILDSVAFLEITKHPTLTFDLMRDVDRIGGISRLVAYQMHERCDGSGYPRGRLENQIHPLSKIAAVADVFVALISPRPHRPAIMPYYAIEHLLRGAQQGLFGRKAVQGLLRTVSLFPLGSYVQLNDQRVARVLRTNGHEYTRPILEVWLPDGSQAEPEIVNLMQATTLEVARPLSTLPSEIRPALPQPPLPPDAPYENAGPHENVPVAPAVPD